MLKIDPETAIVSRPLPQYVASKSRCRDTFFNSTVGLPNPAKGAAIATSDVIATKVPYSFGPKLRAIKMK